MPFLLLFRGKVVASAIFFHFGDKAYFEFGESDQEYHYIRANHLLMWHAIKLYAEEGYKTICLGRSDIANAGLRRYKASWGAKESPLNYYRYGMIDKRFVTNNTRHLYWVINFLFGKMPLGVV